MISFQNVPPVLRAGRPWHISLPPASNPSCRPQSLTLDDGFLGITTLYAPSPRDHKVDIVAISGLGGHAFGSFKGKEGEHMWLRDALPYDIKGEGHNNPPARVIVYGYESNLEQRDSFQSIEDLGTAFRSSLLRLVGAGTIRPIIFIAHSLGGLVVKQTLISLSKSKNEDHQKLLQAVYGIAFFGVPHDGMAIGSLRAIVGDGENRVLLESVSNINSQILTQQRRNFPEALGGEGESEVLCFYETRMSPTAVQVEGKWQMTGPSEVLVTKASATHCQPWGDREEHICAINRTHSEMVKFQLGDQDYLNALDHIWCLVRRALSKNTRPSLTKEHRQQLRESLAFDQIEARYTTIKRAHKETCTWLKTKDEYLDWLNPSKIPEHHGFLWVKGNPGTGKSTLMKFVLDEA